MTKGVDDVFEHELDTEDTVDVMIGSGYGDLIDIMSEASKPSIFDTEKEDQSI